MWGAIKGDLLEFVNVIQKDVSEVINELQQDTDNTPASSSSPSTPLDNQNTNIQQYKEDIANSRTTYTEVSSNKIDNKFIILETIRNTL